MGYIMEVGVGNAEGGIGKGEVGMGKGEFGRDKRKLYCHGTTCF